MGTLAALLVETVENIVGEPLSTENSAEVASPQP